MSSLVRRIQKNIAKSQGYYRSTTDVPYKEPDGSESTRSIKVIRNSDGEPCGFHWPQVKAPTKEVV